MAEKLGSACIPTPDFDDGQDDRIPFFDPPTIELMRRVGCEDVRHHEFKPAGVTNLEEGIVVKAKEVLRQLNMVGGVWDKAPTKFYAVCSVLRDARLLKDTLGGTKFTIWGWCASVFDTHHVIISPSMSYPAWLSFSTFSFWLYMSSL